MNWSASSTTERWRGDSWLARALVGYAQDFPPFKGKTRTARALMKLCFRDGLPLVNCAGARLLVDPLDYIGYRMWFAGSFEPLSVALACKIMQGGGAFLDVGANVGLFTCAVAALPGVECIAVEASPAAFVKLQENLRRNNGARITAVNAAVGARRSLISFVAAYPGNLGTGRIADSSSAPGQIHRTPCISLDELLQDLKTGPIKLMKIDVEGYELEVFRGLNFDAEYAPSNIITEYSKHAGVEAEDLAGCVQVLNNQGYRPYTVTGEPHVLDQPLLEDNIWWRRDET